MTCTTCGDKGIVRLKYTGGEPDEFALCLCAAGQAWRNETNASKATSPLWHLWAAREQVEHERIGPIEAFFEDAELRRMFPAYGPEASKGAREDVLLAAGRTRKAKL